MMSPGWGRAPDVARRARPRLHPWRDASGTATSPPSATASASTRSWGSTSRSARRARARRRASARSTTRRRPRSPCARATAPSTASAAPSTATRSRSCRRSRSSGSSRPSSGSPTGWASSSPTRAAGWATSATGAPRPACWRPTSGPPSSTPRSCAPRRRRPRWRSSPRAASTRRRPQRFGCGYAPAGWDALTKHLLAGGFSFEELEKAGLSRQGNRGPMDRFHRRLLWPIRDRGGEVVGFGARRLYDDDRIEAKYLNTAETPVYRKTHVLFGLDLAKSEIVKRRQVVVVEGYTDVMAMHLAGVPTAVASCGTAFGAEHIGGDQKAHRRRLVRPRRGHLHLRRRRRGPGRRAQGVRGRAGVRHPDLRHDRARRPGPLRAAPDPGRRRGARPRGPPRADLRVRDPLGAARVRPRHAPRAGWPRCSARCRWSPGSSARSCATSTPAASRAGRAGTTSRWSCGGCGRRRARRSSRAAAVRSSAPPKDDPRLHVQREALKAALQVPGDRRARATTSCPSRRSPTPRWPPCTGRCRRRAGSAPGCPASRGWRPCAPGARPEARARGVGAGRRADGAAPAHALALGERRGPLRGEHRRRACGSRWWRRRWRS